MSAALYATAQRGSPNAYQFNYAMAVSIALHIALLFAFSLQPLKRTPVAPGPIVARLAPASAPASPPAPAQPEPPKPRVEEPTPPPVAKTPPPKPVPAPRAAPAPKAQAKAPSKAPAPAAPSVAPQPATPSATPAPSVPATPSAAPAPAIAKADPAPSAPPAPPADAGSLETYRMDILRMARKYKRYPRAAMDNNWEGRAVVRMVIGANGLISSITVTTSSGHQILDKQAIDMIQKAKPLVQIPAALRGKEFPVEIPVIYSLKEPDAS